MKTPEEILMEKSPTPAAGYHSSWIIQAMKEYAKQYIDEADGRLFVKLFYFLLAIYLHFTI